MAGIDGIGAVGAAGTIPVHLAKMLRWRRVKKIEHALVNCRFAGTRWFYACGNSEHGRGQQNEQNVSRSGHDEPIRDTGSQLVGQVVVTWIVGEQSPRRTASAIATSTSRGPSKDSLACAVRTLSKSIRSPACHRSRVVFAS